MTCKKNIILLFFLFFILILMSGFGTSPVREQIAHSGHAKVLAQNQSSGKVFYSLVLELEGIVHPVLKINEVNNRAGHNYKGNKKYFSLHLFDPVILFSNSLSTSYSLTRMNRLGFSPFYIVYRQLII